MFNQSITANSRGDSYESKMKKWLFPLIGLLISAIFLYFGFRNLKIEAVLTHIRDAEPLWLLIGAVVYFLGVTLISLRWRFLLRAIKQIPLKNLVPLVIVGYMGNNVYPFRSGEFLRVILLQRRERIPVARAMTTVIVERVFDGLVMLTFIAVSLLLGEIASPEIRRIVVVAAPLFVTALAIFFILAARPNLLRRLLQLFSHVLPGRLHEIVLHLGEEVIGGLEGLRSPADLAGAVVTSYASWMIEASVYLIVSYAFNLGVTYPVMLLAVGVVNLAGLIPASPGQLGVFEFFVSLVLVAAGVADAQAKAYALVVHVVIWLPVTLAGFFFLARQGLGFGAITHASDLETNAVGG